MLLLIMILVPFVLFLGGVYVLEYPLPLGIMYSFNFALVSVVMWAVINQVTKIHTQVLEVNGGNLRLTRKQLYLSFPLIRLTELEIPLESLMGFRLQPTRAGYLLSVQFKEENKTMGVDLDINPLNVANRDVLNLILKYSEDAEIDEVTEKTLQEYDIKLLSWKSSYMMSFFVIGLALVIFFFISLYLGIGR